LSYQSSRRCYPMMWRLRCRAGEYNYFWWHAKVIKSGEKHPVLPKIFFKLFWVNWYRLPAFNGLC
jgi:hypothetical protein